MQTFVTSYLAGLRSALDASIEAAEHGECRRQGQDLLAEKKQADR
jgi:hypothetical protein